LPYVAAELLEVVTIDTKTTMNQRMFSSRLIATRQLTRRETSLNHSCVNKTSSITKPEAYFNKSLVKTSVGLLLRCPMAVIGANIVRSMATSAGPDQIDLQRIS
jgi:hypothetical protein